VVDGGHSAMDARSDSERGRGGAPDAAGRKSSGRCAARRLISGRDRRRQRQNQVGVLRPMRIGRARVCAGPRTEAKRKKAVGAAIWGRAEHSPRTGRL